MKIGVALSGCDIGGIGAFAALCALEAQGLRIGMVSACGLPSATTMLHTYGYSREECAVAAEQFLTHTQENDMDTAIAKLSAEFPIQRREPRLPLVISSTGVSAGRICAFASNCALSSKHLTQFSLRDPYDALSATYSPADGLASYRYRDQQLCDFSVWYGVPVYPLKMAGFQRILSIAFLPQLPRTPYEVLVSQRITASAHLADIHLPIFPDGNALPDYIAAAETAIEASLERICMKTLF